jgi:glycosyltransferase involved in cell wall biosynthesis
LEAELRARIEAAGVSANVRLIGFLPEEALPLAYRAADVGVVPSQALEGFGLVALECLAAGTPAVVTPVGGLPEAVGPLTSLVCEDASAGALAERIDAMIEGVGRPSAAACRAHAQAHDWDVIAGRVAEVYRTVLAR